MNLHLTARPQPAPVHPHRQTARAPKSVDATLLMAQLQRVIQHGSDDTSALDRMLEHVVLGLGATSACLAVLDNTTTDHLVIGAGIGMPPATLGTRIRLGIGLLGMVASDGRPRLQPGAGPAAVPEALSAPALSICWPLMIRSRLIGALSISRGAGSEPFTQRDIGRGTGLVTVLALLTDNMRLLGAQQHLLEQLSGLAAEALAIKAELKAAQAQLLQSDKLASIGQLAAGVAHEINNPIGYVHANFNALSGYVTKLLAVAEGASGTPSPGLQSLSEDLPDLLRETREGLERVTRIVRDLKDFSRVDTRDGWESADLLAGLESTLNIVQHEIKYKASIERQLVALPPVPCRLSEINQVFMNLLVNAAQAIPDHGVIRLASGFDEQTVWLEVADNGRGMPAQVRQRIFEPFYTTKPVGQGTGLGLSLSSTIMQRHNGRIDVQSEPGRGSAFRITLPRSQPEDSTGASQRAASAAAHSALP